MPKTDNSSDSLRISLEMHRKLLSLVKTPRSEQELVRFVVDSLWEQFREYRVCYSILTQDGDVNVLYSREPSDRKNLSGFRTSFASAPEYLHLLRSGGVVKIADVFQEPKLGEVATVFHGIAGLRARADCTFELDDRKFGLISLSHPEPREWPDFEIELLSEVAELVRFLFREARTQEKLKRSETMFRQFAEHIDSVFWMTDPKKNQMIYVSPAYEKVWGRSRESLYSEPLSFVDAIHDEDRERVVKAILEQSTRPYEEIYRVVRPDGTVRWVKDRGFMIRNEIGEVYRIVGIAEDISALTEARTQLERTQEQVIANAKFAALGEMASGIAHEINNPLAVIHGLALQMKEMGKARGDVAKVQQSLETIEKMANRIAGIVRGLRTFSRKTELDPMVEADLISIVKETLAICVATFGRSGVELAVEIEPDSIPVRCRPSEISQVLLNLLNNAFDALESSEQKWIRIGAKVWNERVVVSVEDGGTGVSREIGEKIFQPFFTTKEVGKGTGLGLSISKGIIEAHGGILYWDPESKHTRFVIELPLLV